MKVRIIMLAFVIMMVFSACENKSNTDENIDKQDIETNVSEDENNKGDKDSQDNENNKNGKDSVNDQAGQNNSSTSDSNEGKKEPAIEERTIEELIISETFKDYVDDKEIINSYIDANVEGKLSFISAREILKKLKFKTVDGSEGARLSDVIDFVKMKDSDSYIITSVENSSIGVSKNDCQNGILYVDKEGNYAVKFEGFSDRTNIDKIISISTMK